MTHGRFDGHSAVQPRRRAPEGEFVRDDVLTIDGPAVSLDAKVAFLGRPEAYDAAVSHVTCKETHMSWVFLAGEKVYKLKKPVRFPYLDFSTLARREAACRAELALNRRLARDVYLAVEPLMQSARGLAIGGAGEPVDWLVVMRRLDEARTLDHILRNGAPARRDLDRLVATLAAFYQRVAPIFVSPDKLRCDWQRSLAYNKSVLLDPRLGLPAGLVRSIDAAQRRFLAERWHLIAHRLHHRRIVDAHGDLRPEHIFMGHHLDHEIRIIDCLEFNAELRAVDPFDEIAFLCIECERLGAAWVSDYIKRRATPALRDGLSDALFSFYRCHRATLRARLAIAHLLESHPRTPEKWPKLARAYLQLAAIDARRLMRLPRPGPMSKD